MLKLLKVLCMAGLLAIFSVANSWAFFIDFEDGADGAQVNDIDGVSFADFNGSVPMYGDSSTGTYGTTSDDLGYGSGPFHHNGNLWLWAGASADARGVVVDFDNDDGTWFQTGYSSFSAFYIDAYMTDGSVVTVSGAANRNQPMDFLRVDAINGLFIDYVVLHDSGNMWLADDMSGDSSGFNTVPEPATMVLLGLGIAGIAGIRRKRSGNC